MTKWLLRPCEIEREPLSDPSAALSYIFDPVDNIFFTEKDIISALHRLSILEMRFQGHITDRIPFWTGFAFFDGIRHNNLDTLADSIIQTSGILFGPSSDIASINMEWEKLRLDAQACIVANCTLLTSIMEIEMVSCIPIVYLPNSKLTLSASSILGRLLRCRCYFARTS